jgi:N-carbamoyl-L-amino-acid hydrolase
VLLRDALAATLAATPGAKPRAFGGPVADYIEAHIEQGPLLEAAGRTIGVVTGIQGTHWIGVELRGESAHVGTTSLSSRRDAFQAAISAIHELNQLVAEQPEDLRFTIGRFDVLPNTSNSVAERVSFTIDVRHPDAGVIEAIGTDVERMCSGRTLGCDFKISRKFNRSPCVFPQAVVNMVEMAAARLGETHMRMVSGAFHDALFMDDICPTGMIFVPCELGISHNPRENAAPADLAAGTRVLLASLV